MLKMNLSVQTMLVFLIILPLYTKCSIIFPGEVDFLENFYSGLKLREKDGLKMSQVLRHYWLLSKPLNANKK